MSFLPRIALTMVGIAATVCIVFPVLIWDTLSGSDRHMAILKGLDCTGAATFGGDGKTTISYRANQSRMRGERWGCLLCKLLDRIQRDHCEKSVD